MAKQLLVEESELPYMLEYYRNRRSGVANEIRQKQQELEGLDKIIAQLSMGSNMVTAAATPVNDNKADGYPYEETWLGKLKFVVAELGSATTTKIVDTLLDYEPSNKSRRKTLVPTISSKLSDNAGEGGLFIREKRNGHFEYRMA